MRWPRPVTVLVAALACYAGLALPGAVASATVLPMANCSGTSGVIVAVNFTPWNGQIQRSCGADGATGYQLLTQSWNVQGAARDPGFICRIGTAGAMYPTAAQDACIVTPPASAYWSYWHADSGQSTWSYSQLGASSYYPKPGSIDYWQYGGTSGDGGSGQPTVSPNSLRAQNTTTPVSPLASAPPPAAPPAAAGAAATTKAISRSAASVAAGPSSTTRPSTVLTSSAPATTTPAPSAAAGTPSTSAPASAGLSAAPVATGASSSSTAAPMIVNAQPRALVRPSTGTPWATLGVGALVIVAGAATGALRWRRRAQ